MVEYFLVTLEEEERLELLPSEHVRVPDLVIQPHLGVGHLTENESYLPMTARP